MIKAADKIYGWVLLLSCYPHEIILHSIYGHLLKGIVENPVEAMDNLLEATLKNCYFARFPCHSEIKMLTYD